MLLTIEDARALAERAMQSIDYSREDAAVIADHLIDCELRGVAIGGLARVLTVIEADRARGTRRRPMTLVRDTDVSATLYGGDQVGYLVAKRATELAIEKAQRGGVGLVGAIETAYTGMFSYYMEMATSRGLVAMAAGSSGNFVAPHGGSEGRFGTNPIAFGFPTDGQPVIWDAGTSSIMLADVVLRHRLGRELPEGVAFDVTGALTRDPAAALAGAFAVWGGHKGSGLAMVVQLFGMLCGAEAMPHRSGGVGFFVLALDPALLTDADDFRRRAGAYARTVRETRPVDGAGPVRVPFDRSAEARAAARERDEIVVADDIYHALLSVTEAPDGEKRA